MTQKISVILPTYNEKANILLLTDAIHNELKNHDHEILVVDDNSPDGTYQHVLDNNSPYIKPILRTENRGLANSIRCGLENAGGDIFVIMDSDFNHQTKYLPFMINAIAYYDCVSASRFTYGGKMHSRTRHIFSWIFNIFIRLMTKCMITDSLYGFLAIRKNVIEQCRYDDIFWGYGDYCIRLMFYLQKNNANVLQFPAVNGKRERGQGNESFFNIFCQYLFEVIKLTYKVRIQNRV